MRPGLKELRLAQRPAAGFDAEAGEGVVDDLGEVVVVADDEGEDADIERFLDQSREDVLVRRHRPEEAGERDVDGDEHAGEPADIALHEAEAGIDVLGEDAQKIVDDAGAAHVAYRSSDLSAGFGSAALWRGRGALGGRRGEEAAAVLGPGGFAAGVVLGGHADRLAARQLAGEGIARDGRGEQRRARRRLVVTAVKRRPRRSPRRSGRTRWRGRRRRS